MKYKLLLALLVIFSFNTRAEIIFQSNFDSDPDSFTGSTVPSGWEGWYTAQITDTCSAGSHYTGEVFGPGRGGSGKALYQFKCETASSGYAGALQSPTISTSVTNFYVRWTMLLPTAITADYSASSGNYQKLFRFTTTHNEIYVDLIAGTPFSFPGGASMHVIDTVIAGNVTVVPQAKMSTLFDGAWHTYEINFNTASGTITSWVDGVQQYTGSFGYPSETITAIAHFGMGNRSADVVHQSSWVGWGFDDFMVADAYIGPPGGDPPVEPAAAVLTPFRIQ